MTSPCVRLRDGANGGGAEAEQVLLLLLLLGCWEDRSRCILLSNRSAVLLARSVGRSGEETRKLSSSSSSSPSSSPPRHPHFRISSLHLSISPAATRASAPIHTHRGTGVCVCVGGGPTCIILEHSPQKQLRLQIALLVGGRGIYTLFVSHLTLSPVRNDVTTPMEGTATARRGEAELW